MVAWLYHSPLARLPLGPLPPPTQEDEDVLAAIAASERLHAPARCISSLPHKYLILCKRKVVDSHVGFELEMEASISIISF